MSKVRGHVWLEALIQVAQRKPQNTIILPRMMDSLPTEVLVRILLFLPPKAFYLRISLVCRRFRDAAAITVPGCDTSEISVACALSMWEESGMRIMGDDKLE
ncbi:hypothetical protein M427DRAFT_60233 [Gonapodya prolifera JEL478]|uniref:F-box domain-containing protein n=1 Tax=Gonapodya prolifera (strain JEL478) TaxID=1344416 RepID=A0A139A4W2_GONPJ|nr:hypothetical protein M427DRAFT_60233 [Gonapodya prolifera JEL478]|eukprot:KXS11781.1 hypothetical protein M427DRAFT_60233 [Gonapodya prolifera JEL478]